MGQGVFFYETPLGEAITNDDGRFSIDLSTSRRESFLLDNKFDLVFKIYQGESLLHSTIDSVLKNVDKDIAEIVLKVPDDVGTSTEPIVPPEMLPVPGSSDFAATECRVSGTVVLADGQPAVGYKVSAADRELVDARQLSKEATTNEQGRYDIAYTLSQLEHPDKGAPDLIVSVFDSGGVLLLDSPLQRIFPY